jgi:WD40 repeat protein
VNEPLCFLRYLLFTLLPCLATANGAEPPVTALLFAPGGESLLIGSQAGVRVLSWPAMQLDRTLPIELSHVGDLAFSSDGTKLAVAGGSPAEEGIVEVLSWPAGERLHRWSGSADVVTAIAWTADSRRLVTGGLDHAARLIDAGDGTVVRTFEGHSRGLTAVRLLQDDQLLLTAGLDQNLRLWEVETGRLVRSFANHTAPIHDLAVRPGGDGPPLVATVSDDRTVRFWQPTIGRMVRFARLDAVPLFVVWLPDAPSVVVGCADGRVRVIDAETATVTRELPALSGWVYSIAVAPSGRHVVAGGTGGELKSLTLAGDD